MTKATAQVNERVVLIPGIWMNRLFMKSLGRRCRQAGFQVSYFDYSHLSHTPEDILQQLHLHIHSYKDELIHLVGHSYGGLLANEFCRQSGIAPIRSMLMLGTPVLGSATARDLSRRFFGHLILGKSQELLIAGSNEPTGTPTGMIAGNLGLGLGRLVTRVECPCDGAVSVAETQAGWLADHIIVKQSHAGMLFSSSVAEQAIYFLRHSVFRR